MKKFISLIAVCVGALLLAVAGGGVARANTSPVDFKVINRSTVPLKVTFTYQQGGQTRNTQFSLQPANGGMKDKNPPSASIDPFVNDSVCPVGSDICDESVRATITYPPPAGNLDVIATNPAVGDPSITVNGEQITLGEGVVQERDRYNFPFIASRQPDSLYKNLVLELLTPNV